VFKGDQLCLFWSELHIREWCGKRWMTRVWRLWDGTMFDEEFVMKLEDANAENN